MSISYPLISVIVPVYKVEDYINKCIDSIINQSYENLEIILINDGSPDRCPQICDEYALKDNRIKVIHKKNGGQSSARNMALDIARGEYIGFVDSDDWILPNMFEKLYLYCINNSVDIAICDSYSDEIRDYPIEEGRITILEKSEFMPMILNDKIGSQPWNKLYKRELFENNRFPEGKIVEDMLLFHKICDKANKILITNEKLYVYYLSRSDNTSNDKSKLIENAYYRGEAFRDRYLIAEKSYITISQDVLKKAVSFSLGAYIRMINNKEKYINQIRELDRFFKENKTTILKSPNVDFMRKILIWIITLNKSN